MAAECCKIKYFMPDYKFKIIILNFLNNIKLWLDEQKL